MRQNNGGALTIRPFNYSDDDYHRLVAINAAVFNEPGESVEEWKHDDEVHDSTYPYYRDMVERDGLVIAYVETFQSRFAYHPQKYRCLIFVDPPYDAVDVRPAVWEYVLEKLADQELIAIESGMLEDKPEAMRFFEEYGFERVREASLSRLEVTRFDPTAYATTLAQVSDSGIEIASLRELQERDPDWQRKLYDLDVTVNRDIPSSGEKHYPDFPEWVKTRLEKPSFDPDAWFVALDGDQYVGQSQGSINKDSDPVKFDTGVTAVRREYRRRSIATALKVHVIRHVQALGVQEISTSNEASSPMFRLNLKLGFEPQPTWVWLEKKL